MEKYEDDQLDGEDVGVEQALGAAARLEHAGHGA